MSENLWPKYYQENKCILQKKKKEKKEKEKKQQYGRKRYKHLSEDEKINWLSIEKNIIKWGKTLFYNYMKLLI